MIPYFPQPVFHLGAFQIHAYGVLVAAAVVIGGLAILRRAPRLGIPAEQMFHFCFWVYASAIAGAYLSNAVMDNFPAFLADPSRIFRVTLGVKSAGGVAGGFLGGLVWCGVHKLSLVETLRRLDVVAYSTPLAFMIGRVGCTLAHDHRGIPSTSWIAVNFPEGPRLDLGLIEFLFLIGMVLFFRVLDRRPRTVGFFFGMYGVVYGGFRIWLETLRTGPNRMWPGIAGVVVGLLGWAAMWWFERSRIAGANVRRVAAD